MLAQLILVPTALELTALQPELTWLDQGSVIELCGFGPVAAAARTAALIARWQPRRVILVGIAGALDPRLQVGRAYQFDEVVCYGVGVGSGENYQTVGEMGWSHWGSEPAIGDWLQLGRAAQPESLADGPLLTACAGAADADDVFRRRRKFPKATAEDMEGFAVAVACRLADVPLQIIRGISNVAGQRDKQQWHITPALRSASQLLHRAVERS